MKSINNSSLSARRAWIEMVALGVVTSPAVVALRKESVDRNAPTGPKPCVGICRSPQGERG